MTKIFDNPANPMEQEIANHIKPLLTLEVEAKIEKDKLTLKGCVKYCYDKGKKFIIKSGKDGIAHIDDEQHWKWVREYFGITDEAAAPPPIHMYKPEAAKGALDLDLESLFDF